MEWHQRHGCYAVGCHCKAEGAAREVAFIVYGQPVSKGSAQGFVVKKKGAAGNNAKDFRSVVVPNNKKSLRDWEGVIRDAAQRYAAAGFYLDEGEPVDIEFWFYFTRPKSKKRTAPMTVKPDFDKLARAVADAITKVLFKDDSQITDAGIHKRYVDDGASHVKVIVRRANAA